MVINVEKVWGKEVWMANTNKYCGKLLYLLKGKKCSLHYHKRKDETFYVYAGKVLIEIKQKNHTVSTILKPGDSIRIHKKEKHRFMGIQNSLIIEISTNHQDSDSYREKNELSGIVSKETMEKYENV